MSRKRADYIWHVTLDTGHGVRSHRCDVDSTVITIVGQQVAEALKAGSADIRPGYRIEPHAAGAALMAMVVGDTAGPLVSVAVAPHSRVSARLWGLLEQDGPAPAAPWCAIRMLPDVVADLGALSWLGDFERCLAWAWLERNDE